MASLKDSFLAHKCPEAVALISLLTSDRKRTLEGVSRSDEMAILLDGLCISEEMKFHITRLAGDTRRHEKFGTSLSDMHSMKWIGMRYEHFFKEEREDFKRACTEIVRLASLEKKPAAAMA